jgi:sRNA-binding protein
MNDKPPSCTPEQLVSELEQLLGTDLWPELARVINAKRPLPFAIGVHQHLAELMPADDPRQTELRAWFSRWTSRSSYLWALIRHQAMRHDLDGNPVEPVSPKHQALARKTLNERKARRERQRAAIIEADQVATAAERAARSPNAARPTLTLGGRAA